MKVYVDIDDTRKITTYHNGLGIEQGLYYYGNDKIEVLSLTDYTKQVRKEVCEEIIEEFEPKNANYISETMYPPTKEANLISKGFKACKQRLFKKLDQIRGETK